MNNTLATFLTATTVGALLLVCCHNVVVLVEAAGVVTIAGSPVPMDNTDPHRATMRIGSYGGFQTFSSGDCFLADKNHIVRVHQCVGAVTTIAGNPNVSDLVDHADPLQARFSSISAMLITQSGDMFIADYVEHAGYVYVIRKIQNRGSGAVTTVAGTGFYGDVDNDDPLLASFSPISSMTQLKNGDCLIVVHAAIRRFRHCQYEITTLSGNGISASTGVRDNADPRLALWYSPAAVLQINDESCLVGDYSTIRRIDGECLGAVSTVAGNAAAGAVQDHADPLQAILRGVFSMVMTASGDCLFLSTTGFYGVRKFAGCSGAITSIAGGTERGYQNTLGTKLGKTTFLQSILGQIFGVIFRSKVVSW